MRLGLLLFHAIDQLTTARQQFSICRSLFHLFVVVVVAAVKIRLQCVPSLLSRPAQATFIRELFIVVAVVVVVVAACHSFSMSRLLRDVFARVCVCASV